MNFIGSGRPAAVVASGMLAIGLGGCDTFAPLEMRCAAFFYQLSEVNVGDVPPSRRVANRRHALAFIDRLPGNRADNIAAMRKIGDSIMADDGLREECDRTIPFLDKSLETA